MRRVIFVLSSLLIVGSAGCQCGTPPATEEFSVGGNVQGLTGTGLVLKSSAGEELAISADGPFAFPTRVAAGTEITISVQQQPSEPTQSCTIAGGTFVVTQDVTDVAVTCETTRFKVGGTVIGLEGMGLELVINDAETLDVSADGPFQFAGLISSGETFTVSVKTQPSSPTQTCVVMGGSGTVVSGDVTSIAVNCATDLFTIGGTVSGLEGAGLVLQNNGGDDLAVSANGTFAFAAPILSGQPFAVTVKAQPASPQQTCTVSAGEGSVIASNVTSVAVTCTTNAYLVGGTLTGLEGSGLVLQNELDDDLSLSADGAFTFATPIASGQTYAVSVLTQPTSPWQTCAVANATGTVTDAEVSDVEVVCTTNSYVVGGTVTGLEGSGLVLHNNGGDALSISADGSFAFASPILSGTTFEVTVATQPTSPWQTCTVTGGSGSVLGADVTSITVNCAKNQYALGGTVSGLLGSGLELSLNGGPSLAVSADGTFAFPTTLASGEAYAVTLVAQPSSPWQTCSLSNSSGTVGGADVTDIAVTCATNSYTVGGTVSGLTGSGLTLANNGGDALQIGADGTFTFNTQVPSGQPYAVTVSAQPTSPWQTCSVSSGSGTISNGHITNVTIACVTNTYQVSGTISGLAGTVVLQNNGGDDLVVSANGAFSFATQVTSGAAYQVTVKTQPTSPWQTCTISSGAGTITNAAVTDVAVSCITHTYPVGGVVSGLQGSGLKLTNNGGDEVAISANGAFQFPAHVQSGAAYLVAVSAQPGLPWQTCTVSGGSGTVGGAAVTSVQVNCVTNTYSVGGTVSGLSGSGLTVANGSETLTLSGNGTFAFNTTVPSGGAYAVTVVTQPTQPWQTCAVTNGSGTVSSSNVTSVAITCQTNQYNVAVNVTGLAGSGLVLQNNGGNNLAVGANGVHTFTTKVTSGQPYNVTVLTQPTSPWQTCTVAAGAGTMGGANVTLQVACTANSYPVGGVVSGLSGQVVLRLNGGNNLTVSANGGFTFGAPVASGSSYTVTVLTQPSTQTCSVSNGTGTMGGAPVTNVSVTCANYAPLTYQILHNGYYYATLDDAPPSAQYGTWINTCQTSPLPIPNGWQLAPEDPSVITNVIAPNIWGTHCILFANGVSYGVQTYSGGQNCMCSGTQCMSQSPSGWAVTSCSRRILIRRPQ